MRVIMGFLSKFEIKSKSKSFATEAQRHRENQRHDFVNALSKRVNNTGMFV